MKTRYLAIQREQSQTIGEHIPVFAVHSTADTGCTYIKELWSPPSYAINLYMLIHSQAPIRRKQFLYWRIWSTRKISWVHGMHPANCGDTNCAKSWGLGHQQSSKIMPVCLLPSHQCMQNEPSDMCDKVVLLLLGSLPFVSWLFGNLKPGRKVVKPEGANLGPRGAHSPSLWHKQNKILTLPTVRQPIQSACVWGTVTDSLLWRAVFENLFCMVTSALLQLHIWTDVNSEQDRDSLCS